jgi:general stress protein YciG
MEKKKRGFALMNPEKQKQIARKGGKAAHEQGVAHQWNSEEARNAGRKGGSSAQNNNLKKKMNEGS